MFLLATTPRFGTSRNGNTGRVVAHEMCKGLAVGIIGGLAVGAFLALQKLGSA